MNVSNTKQMFNWVHRKFHYNILKVPNVKQTVDMLVAWRHDILVTERFGFDPLKSSLDQPKEHLIDENEDEDDYIEGEMHPLMFVTFEKYFKEYIDVIGTNKLDFLKMERKGGRVTLSDLFLADSDVKINIGSLKMPSDSCKKSTGRIKKKEITLAKKITPHIVEDSAHIKKLPKLMKTMLNKKIHPDEEIKFQKMDGQMKSVGKESQRIDSVSLLPTTKILMLEHSSM